MRPVRVLFAGGGTGGHLFPAIAIADEVRALAADAEIHFVGTKNKIEARIVPQKGYEFHSIWISGFRRRFHISNLLVPLKIIVSMMQALSIIRSFRPDVVVGTGGYVSGPVLRAAMLLRIPTLIQEQNSYPGVTTRILSRRVNEVHVTFESSLQYFKRRDNVVVSGNPTRNDLENVSRNEALEFFGFSESNKPAILVVGGSLGAHSINVALEQCIGRLMERKLRIIWQTGKADIQDAVEVAQKYPADHIWVHSFIDRMEYAYAVADIVVCRAGATTIAELTRLGKPAILIPYPFATANHQVENARSLADAGAAVIVSDERVSEDLEQAIVMLLDDQRREQVRSQCLRFGKPGAANDIARRVLVLSRKNK